MKGSRGQALVAAATMAAASIASVGHAIAANNLRPGGDPNYRRVPGGQPWRGTAGMGHGSKTRGNAAVRRAAQKLRNKLRARAAKKK